METYAGNFSAKTRVIDLQGITPEQIRQLVHLDLTIPHIDVILGGPPCHGFADAVRAKTASRTLRQQQRPPRDDLYREFVQFVDTLRPHCFVMEFAPRFATFHHGEVAGLIRDDFDRIGYELGAIDGEGPGLPLLLDAQDFGVPQTRKQLFFLGFRRGVTAPVDRPRATHQRPLKQRGRTGMRDEQPSLWSLTAREPGSDLWLPAPRSVADGIADLPALQPPALAHTLVYVPRHRTDLIERGALRDANYRELMRAGMSKDQAHLVFDHVVRAVRGDDALAFLHIPEGGAYTDVPVQYRRRRLEDNPFRRLNWDRPSPVVTATLAKDGYRHIHPDGEQGRPLSVREAARIQSFPDWFRFAGHRTSMYRQIGDAVPPLLSQALAHRIREAIEHDNSRTR